MAVVNPFQSLIEGVLEGHQIAQQMRHQAMQEEAFQRAKEREAHEAQLKDLEAQQYIANSGRPVTNGTVQQSFDAPVTSEVPGIAPTPRTISYSRPADKNRLQTYKTFDGRTFQSEAYTPDEAMQRQIERAMQQKGAEALANSQIADAVKAQMLARHGRVVPEYITSVLGLPAGYVALESDIPGLAEKAAAVKKGQTYAVRQGEDLVEISPDRPNPFGSAPMLNSRPKPQDAGPVMVGLDGSVASPQAPEAGQAVEPLPAAAPGDAAASRVPLPNATPADAAAATKPGNSTNLLHRVPPKPDKPTGDFQAVFLPAFAEDHGTTVEKLSPQLRMQAVKEYAERGRDPETTRLTHQLAQARLDEIRAQNNSVPITKEEASKDPVARAIAEYKLAPPLLSRSGPGARIMRNVMTINPDYQAQNWQAQGKVLNDFTSGSTSKSITAMNTALGHLGELYDAAQALHNGNIQVLNQIANRLGVAVGKNPVTTYQTIVHRVGPEITRAYIGAGGTAGDRGTTEKDFDPKLGLEQNLGNIAESVKLFLSKFGAEEFRWKQVMGERPIPFGLSPDAQKTMQKVAPPKYDFIGHTEDGHKIGTNDRGVTWFDVATGKRVQ